MYEKSMEKMYLSKKVQHYISVLDAELYPLVQDLYNLFQDDTEKKDATDFIYSLFFYFIYYLTADSGTQRDDLAANKGVKSYIVSLGVFDALKGSPPRVYDAVPPLLLHDGKRVGLIDGCLRAISTTKYLDAIVGRYFLTADTTLSDEHEYITGKQSIVTTIKKINILYMLIQRMLKTILPIHMKSRDTISGQSDVSRFYPWLSGGTKHKRRGTERKFTKIACATVIEKFLSDAKVAVFSALQEKTGDLHIKYRFLLADIYLLPYTKIYLRQLARTSSVRDMCDALPYMTSATICFTEEDEQQLRQRYYLYMLYRSYEKLHQQILQTRNRAFSPPKHPDAT